MDQSSAVILGKSRSDCAPEYLEKLMDNLCTVLDVPGDVAEFGSYLCGAAICMAAKAPEKTVYSFDLFGGLPYGPGAGFENFGGTSFIEIKIATSPFKNLKLVKGKHEDTVPKFNKKLSFIHMDSDFYSSHRVCLEHCWPLLSPGGIIMFHDWDNSFPGVQRAVAEVFDAEKKAQCDIFTPELIRKSKFSQSLG